MQKTLFSTTDLEPEIVKKIEQTLESKRKAGLLTEEHAALCQLAVELGRAIAAGASKGKTSVAQSAQQLLNVLEALPSAPVEETADILADEMRAGL